MRITALLLGMLLMVMMPVRVNAETYYGNAGWGVTFTADKQMVSNFSTDNINDVVGGMQPGDTVIVTLTLKNENEEKTDWYMTNQVLKSLEDSSSAAGGAYTYILTYTDHEGKQSSLYSSDTVGGEVVGGGGEGLHEATNALKDFFYLDELAKGQTGTITLQIALDGETQGNSYQDTLANLSMNFAVELESDLPPIQLVKTGDENLPVILVILMATAGVVLMGLSIYSMVLNRKARRG